MLIDCMYRKVSEISAALGNSATIIKSQNNYWGNSATPNPSLSSTVIFRHCFHHFFDHLLCQFCQEISSDHPRREPILRKAMLIDLTGQHLFLQINLFSNINLCTVASLPYNANLSPHRRYVQQSDMADTVKLAS